MKVGIFDSGLGGLTVVSSIAKTFEGGELFYIADTKFAPYGQKTKEQILQHSIEITKHLIQEHQIEALIVACNSATSAAIKELRELFPKLIVIGTEPGIKPAIETTKSQHIGILATPATLKGEKYQELLKTLDVEKKVTLYEQACAGLVEQIEKGESSSSKTKEMLQKWLEPMRKNNVDSIVLGCTHYPLVANEIKEIMGEETVLIETGVAIAKRLNSLSLQKGHLNQGLLKVFIYSTNGIHLKVVDQILDEYSYCGSIDIRRDK